jgi:hypothetical protein
MWLGAALILMGVALVLIPIIGAHFDLSKIPSWLIYVYRSNGFCFVTSPILIVISILSILAYLLMR